MHISRKRATWLVFAALISAALVVISLFVSCATMLESDLTPEQARVVEVIDCPGIEKDRLFVLCKLLGRGCVRICGVSNPVQR